LQLPLALCELRVKEFFGTSLRPRKGWHILQYQGERVGDQDHITTMPQSPFLKLRLYWELETDELSVLREEVVDALVAVVLLGSIAPVTARYELRRDAERITHSSYELFQQGQRPSLDNVRRRFGEKLKQTGPCGDVGCGFEVMLSNYLLALFVSPNFRLSNRCFG